MDMKIIIVIILTAIAAAFFIIKNYTESKTDDVEKEIKKVMQKNRQSSTSGSTPRRTEYTTAPAPVKKAATLPRSTQPQTKKASANPNKKLIAAVIGMVMIAITGFSVIMQITDDYSSDDNSHFEFSYDDPSRDNFPYISSADDDFIYGGLLIPDGYMVTDYNIVGNNKIIDIDGVTVSIGDFYEDSFMGEGRGEPIIHFSIENNSGKDVSVSFDISGVNRIAGEAVQKTVYKTVSNGTTEYVTRYLSAYVDSEIKELVISHVTVTDKNSGEYFYGGVSEEYEKTLRFTTDSDEGIYYDPWEEEPIYDENDVKIYKAGTFLYIENNSKHDFHMNIYALPENQKTEDTICEDVLLPYGCNINFELSGEYDMFDMDEGRISFSFDFECKDSTSSDFKTGMIK